MEIFANTQLHKNEIKREGGRWREEEGEEGRRKEGKKKRRKEGGKDG